MPTLVDLAKEISKQPATKPNWIEHYYKETHGLNLVVPKKPYGGAVVNGRFQPLHEEHVNLIQGAIDISDVTLVVICSAFEALSLSNPFPYEMRRAMIEQRFPKEVASGQLKIVGLEDYTYRNEKWSEEFYKICKENLGSKFVYYTCAKDEATAEYIDYALPARIKRIFHEPTKKDVHTTDIRNSLFSGIPCLNIPNVSLSVGFSLHAYKLTPEYDIFTKELQALADYQKSWASAPYPPHFVAVDALVTWHDAWDKPYFLVGVRKSEFGNGKWCMPGGFLEVKETLLTSAIRELREETTLAVDDRFKLRNVTTFDDPSRSKRGRMITHVHEWTVASKKKPIVEGQDDLSHAFWLPFDEVYENKRKFFSDHYYIISKLNPEVEDFK